MDSPDHSHQMHVWPQDVLLSLHVNTVLAVIDSSGPSRDCGGGRKGVKIWFTGWRPEKKISHGQLWRRSPPSPFFSFLSPNSSGLASFPCTLHILFAFGGSGSQDRPRVLSHKRLKAMNGGGEGDNGPNPVWPQAYYA